MASASVTLRRRAMLGAAQAERLVTWFIDTQMSTNDLAAIVDTDLNIGKLSNYTNDLRAPEVCDSPDQGEGVSNEKEVIRRTRKRNRITKGTQK